jgi:hypothetical protein
MIRLDFDLACKMARTDLPGGWMIEIHLEKEIGWVDLFQPNGARYDFNAGDTTMSDQMLKAITVAKTSQIVPREVRAGTSKDGSRPNNKG